MRSTYKKEDVKILLKDITGLVKPLSTEEREKRIQTGTHYCEMLPIEYRPTASYLEAYEAALKSCGKETGEAIAAVSEKILKEKGEKVVLVSLARAGTPIGILIKHYIKKAYGIDAPHYTISIIRGRGIDKNAMKYLLNQYEGKQLQFVDGWIGKGAILQVLREAVKVFPTVSSKLAVAADPANVTELCGTHEDILIPSSCLNSTVSGLMSRTFLRNDIIGPEDFHGAVYYEELEKEDKSYEFIQAIEQWFPEHGKKTEERKKGTGLSEVLEIGAHFQISDINLIKPGIGETTRVLLRRVPWKILISEKWKGHQSLTHIYRLAGEKQVEIQLYPLKHYKACGIIKKYSDA